MKVLERLNKEFMKDAQSYRYEYPKLTKKGKQLVSNDRPSDFTPYKYGEWRSVKFKDKNTYLMVFDIDGYGLDENLFNRMRFTESAIFRYMREKPLIKASGIQGAQVIIGCVLDKRYNEKTCATMLLNFAYTVYKELEIKKRYGISFGLSIHVEKPLIDAAMFQYNRMIRGYCTRFKRTYSVPILPNDTYNDIEARLIDPDNGSLDDYKIEISFIKLNEEMIKYKYDIKKELEKYKPSPVKGILDDLEYTKRGDKIYKDLPDNLKKIVSFEGDLHHHYKWPLIVYLYYRYRHEMIPSDIANWVWNNCKWNDLNDIDITTYQVNWTCDWVDNFIKENPYTCPIPHWVFGD